MAKPAAGRMPTTASDRAPAPARWQREFAAEPTIVGEVRRGVAAFARAQGAPEDAVENLSLAVSEATTNAVIHAFVGCPPGRISVIVEPGEDCVLVRVLDDGRGMTPRADSPGLGLGLALIASMTASCDIREGPSARGTEVRMVFAAAGVSDHRNGAPDSRLDAATRRRQPAKGTP